MLDIECAPNHRPDSKIAKVYEFPNGMVIVFDQYGQQMAIHQGPRHEIEAGIRAAGWTGGFNRGEVI